MVHAVTYKALTQDNLKCISSLNLHPATDPNALDLRAAHKNRLNDNDCFACQSSIILSPHDASLCL